MHVVLSARGDAVTMRVMSDLILGPPGPTAPHATAEFRLEEAVRNEGHPYLRYRDGGAFRAIALDPSASPIYIGRDAGCAARILQDALVSRRHARVIFGAGQWSIEDGPSRNGTFVDGKRTTGEQILDDGAMLTVGKTALSFHVPASATVVATLADEPPVRRLHPTPTQRKVLVELARPFLDPGADLPVAPTNAAIAARLGYQAATIRDAISDLYRQAGLARGTSDQRAELVRLAIREQAVTRHDVRG